MTFYFCWTLSKSNRRVSNSHLRRSRPVGGAAVVLDARAWHTSLPLVMHYSTRKKYMTDSDEKVGNSTNPYHSRFFNWIIGEIIGHIPQSVAQLNIVFPWERDGEMYKKKRGVGFTIFHLRWPNWVIVARTRIASVGNVFYVYWTYSEKKVWHTLLYMYRTLQNGRPAGRRKKSRLSKGVSPPKGVFFVGIKIFAKCESRIQFNSKTKRKRQPNINKPDRGHISS